MQALFFFERKENEWLQIFSENEFAAFAEP